MQVCLNFVEEYATQQLTEFDGKNLKSIMKENLDLVDEYVDIKHIGGRTSPDHVENSKLHTACSSHST